MSENSIALTDYKKLLEDAKALREQARGVAREAFQQGAKALFDQHSDLNSFGWTQYTPYFNDGEPCYFHVNAWDMHVNGYDENEDDGEDYSTTTTGLTDARRKELGKVAREFIQEFAKDDLEEMYGDHVKVIVTPTGVKTEEYDHE